MYPRILLAHNGLVRPLSHQNGHQLLDLALHTLFLVSAAGQHPTRRNRLCPAADLRRNSAESDHFYYVIQRDVFGLFALLPAPIAIDLKLQAFDRLGSLRARNRSEKHLCAPGRNTRQHFPDVDLHVYHTLQYHSLIFVNKY